MTPIVALQWLGVLAAALTILGLTASGVSGYRQRRDALRAVLEAQEAQVRKRRTLAGVRSKRAEN